jgi:DNA-binding beta-propeller fold protein YncE
MKTIQTLFLSTLFLCNVYALDDGALGHNVEALPKKEVGKQLYEKYCASCHHSKRVGIDGPPLLPKTLKKYDVQDLANKIKDGFPQTLMPKYDFLNPYELLQIARYIKSNIKGEFTWTKQDIRGSIVSFDDVYAPLDIKDKEQILPVVERDGNQVWIMEDTRILSKFPLNNVHGGIKYTSDARNIYVPTRDGYIQNYSLKTGQRMNKVRACINLRNVSLSRDDKYLFATCLLPEQLVILDAKSMLPVKIEQLEGKISALYEFYSKDKAVFTFRNKPVLATLDTKTFHLEYQQIKEPIEDFFIDPFEDFLIGTARRGDILSVYDLNSKKIVFEHAMKGMPHLFSATYWYNKGNFYFATPHIKKPYVTVWKMYDWAFEKEVDIKGDGFFVKTHPYTPYLWADNGSDALVLIDKNDFTTKTITPRQNQQYIHTEYSGDGKYAYLSIYDKNGSIVVLDTLSFKELASYDANMPVGKYNFINKNRVFYPRLFGMEIFKQHCNEKLPCNQEDLNAYEQQSLNDYLQFLQ